MLVKITNRCRMECSHCLDDCKPTDNDFMTIDTFKKCIEFIRKNNFMILMMSGGEPLEHPDFFEIADLVLKSGLKSVVLSNGMWIENEELRTKVLKLGLPFQITNDERYYPKRIVKFDHPFLMYESQIRVMDLFGRAKISGMIGTRKAPSCFNLRSAVRHLNNFKDGVLTLRHNGKMCTPYIEIDGSIRAGESKFCKKIGNLDSTGDELVHNILNMKCNYCGLENNLPDVAKIAIGL